MLFCCTWVFQNSGSLLHRMLVEVTILMIRRYIFFYHYGLRSVFWVKIDEVTPVNSFGNRGVFIVLNLIGGIRDTLGNGKGSQLSLLKFFVSCKDLFVIFVEYLLSCFEVVSQLEAIAIIV